MKKLNYPYSQIEIVKSVRISVLPNLIHRIQTITVKVFLVYSVNDAPQMRLLMWEDNDTGYS